MVLLNIRWIQLKREIEILGLRSLFFLGLLCLLIVIFYSNFSKTPNAYYATSLLLLVCISLHFYRKDKLFILNHVERPRLEMYVEYLALIFPFAATSLVTKNGYLFMVLVVTLYGVSFLNATSHTKTYFKNISKIIPASNFEWISGFRKSFYFIIPVYALAIGLSWKEALPLFLLWLVTVSIASFYDECESLPVLRENATSAAPFMHKKIRKHAQYTLILYAPILVINTVINPYYWLINLLFIPVQISLISFAICLKYSSYTPNTKLAGGSILLGFTSLGALTPYLLPVPFVMTLIQYNKAKARLGNYFL